MSVIEQSSELDLVSVEVANGAIIWVAGMAHVAGERVDVPKSDALAFALDGFAWPVVP